MDIQKLVTKRVFIKSSQLIKVITAGLT
jgi:hypothetical protein